jgi:hypothetical protein
MAAQPGKPTLYDVLGLRRDASQRDIQRAYRKAMAELQDERTAPDPRRQVLVKEAYEVLSDPGRREGYDASLRGPTLLGVSGGAVPRKRWTIVFGTLLIALGLAYYLFVARETIDPAKLHPDTDVAMQLHTKASVAIGRVNRIDMSGRSTPLGVAVAVQEGVMMTPCSGLAPGAQIAVSIPPRTAPGEILHADEASGLCRLRMHAGGSWPLPVSAQEPRPGERVFTVHLNAQGEAVLREAKVVQVVPAASSRVVEIAQPGASFVDGSPLLDQQGRVFAVAIEGKHRMLPAAWIERGEAAIPRPSPKPVPVPAHEPEPDPEPRKGPSQERRDRIEKAFRPPPKVPDDI